MKSDKTFDFFLSIAGAFILMFPAIYNGYPLITSDSGAYVFNANQLSHIPLDRPIGYSVLIRIFTLKYSLWLMIFTQSFLLAFLIFRILSKIIFPDFSLPGKLFFLIIVTVFTSIAWYSSQLMADIFTPIMILAAYNYLLSDNKKWAVAYLVVVVVSILTHNSNLLISIFFFAIPLLISLSKNHILHTYKSKLLKLFLSSLLAWLVMCSMHWVGGYGFRPCRATHVFLIAKLAENGILKKYLEDNCLNNSYRLCNFKDQLPDHAWNFIWDPESAFYKTGGWDSSKTEYDKIITGTLVTPKYLLLNIKESMIATVKQIILIDIGDGLGAYTDHSTPYRSLDKHFHEELNRFIEDKQNTTGFDFGLYNQVYFYFLIFSTFISLFLLIQGGANKNLYILFFAVALFVVINAFVTATFANILCRLNSRVMWLIPLANLYVMSQFMAKQKIMN